MALFGRKKQSSVLPDEVSWYYESQRRERIGVAILLGIVALVVTLLIGAALFFGGRYVYRQFFADDKTAPTVTQPVEETDKSSQGTKEQAGSTQNPAPTPTTSPPAASTQNNNSNSSTSPTTPAPQSTPNLGDEPPLPRTGDEGM